ncbi:hypothetical protein DRJ17_05575 [Candidatus Woesearchaeota archaeon]|nr:MAG: hypothetical protein DRJ17_05575 [Candidatus Woesearchaeota archaeon]
MKLEIYARSLIAKFTQKVSNSFSNLKGKLNLGFSEFFQRQTFTKIFYYWIHVILVFGVSYYFLSYIPNNSITYHGQMITQDLTGLLNSIYFSFVTSTSLGYGDIAPLGIAKLLSVIEVISGLIIYGMIISKIVSVKQEKMLEEIHSMSEKEQINRLRSSFYLYRSEINKYNYRINTEKATKAEINDLWMTFTSFDVALMDTVRIMKRLNKNDEFDIGLILNSIDLSLIRTYDLITLLDDKQIMWRKNIAISTLGSILNNTNSVCKQLDIVQDKKIQSQIRDILKMKASINGQINKQIKNIITDKTAKVALEHTINTT